MTRKDIVRDVVGYEGLYKVDIFGNVTRVKDGKEVSQQINQFGYANVSLRKNGKQKQHKLHRVIAEAFIPNPYNKPQVNHIDGNKLHNVVWNLEWSTAKENINHSIKTNLRFIKKVEIVETGKIYDSVTECANDIGGSYGNIYHCLKGRRQTHKNYHFREV